MQLSLQLQQRAGEVSDWPIPKTELPYPTSWNEAQEAAKVDDKD